MKMNLLKFFTGCLILILISGSMAQQRHVPSKERADASVRRQAQLEGNKVRTSIFNHGQTGREGGEFPINVQTPYEWPKNTGKVYLALTGIFVGGEVTDDNGNLQRIIDVCNYRESQAGASWNFEPVPGYFNQSLPLDDQTLANSVERDTWPASWPDKENDPVDPGWRGKWNGYFGKDQFNADQELFYRAADDNYDRYDFYFPDTTDLNRKGLGIILDVRALAWSQVLVEDVVYLLHFVKNDGTKEIKKVGVTIWHADFVGGNGDSQDDISEFDLFEDIAWSRDQDHRAPEFGSDPVGIVGVAFLETPGNAVDRIDNDGDGEEFIPPTDIEDNPILIGKVITEEMIEGEDPTNLIDDNGNGLIDENQTHIPFGTGENVQIGVGYADYMDDNNNGEEGSPVVTSEMVTHVQNDIWKRWPPNPQNDPIQNGLVHLLMVENGDEGKAFKDNIDNNDNGEEDSPEITQAMIDQAASDDYNRYVVGNGIILYDLKAEDLGKKYADGIDNDGNGAVDEFIDERIDEMIDEARNDGIDNDEDWDEITDDVGLDGVADTGDPGEGDGAPTSGAGTNFPGEPNVDVTDVSETDQIGITNADYIPAGGLNINSDAEMWFNFMIPGKFYDPQEVVPGEYDLFVSSSFFPLKAGQVEPIALAVILGNGPVPDPGGEIRKRNVLDKRRRALETYLNDYQFANAPLIPTLNAVAGDNKVTLYWDDIAESSFDDYIANIGGNGDDFEGYRIYRATDPAFEDPLNVTDAFGVLVFKSPIAQFDIVNNYFGLDSIGLNGANFYLGDNSGLRHSWVDESVQNGFTYYYAITSYDHGFPAGQIIPTECPIRISLQADGEVITGQNVVQITPEAPAAGAVPASLGEIDLIQGTTTGQIFYDIVDFNEIKDGHIYHITFEDTLRLGEEQDTLTTLSWTLVDSTTGDTLVNKSQDIFPNIDDPDFEQPLTDGFRLIFENEDRVDLDREKSVWNTDEIPKFAFEKFVFQGGIEGEPRPNDYFVEFGDVGVDTSLAFSLGRNDFPAAPVNFRVFNVSADRYIDFGFIELDVTYGEPGMLSARGAFKDRIVFLEPNTEDSLIYTWTFYLQSEPDTNATTGFRIPEVGDEATVLIKKPFLSSDLFRFEASAARIDNEQAKIDMENIKVVPNPYVATAAWEPANPYNSGRGPRSLHFTHLPNKCTIRIFTINGELVDTIEHESDLNDGAAHWDMLTKDGLSISFGVYIYQVDAPDVGEFIGKFAVIK